MAVPRQVAASRGGPQTARRRPRRSAKRDVDRSGAAGVANKVKRSERIRGQRPLKSGSAAPAVEGWQAELQSQWQPSGRPRSPGGDTAIVLSPERGYRSKNEQGTYEIARFLWVPVPTLDRYPHLGPRKRSLPSLGGSTQQQQESHFQKGSTGNQLSTGSGCRPLAESGLFACFTRGVYNWSAARWLFSVDPSGSWEKLSGIRADRDCRSGRR